MDELVASAEEAVCMQGLQGCSPDRFVELLRREVLASNLSESQAQQHAAVLWRALVQSQEFEVLPAADASGSSVAPISTDLGDVSDIRPLIGLGKSFVILRAKAKQVYGHVVENYVKTSAISPLVWRCLDYVASSGKEGATVVELGKLLKTTQSTVFYLVKTLVEIGLVAKIKCVDGSAFTNLIVHRKYLSTNEAYLARVQNLSADKLYDPTADDLAAPTVAATKHRFQPYGRNEVQIPQFIKSRIRQLLRQDLWHHLIVNNDLLVMTGFAEKPSKRIRVEFNAVTRKMVRDGELDVVLVPRAGGGQPYRCLRLPEFRPSEPEDFSDDLQDPRYIGGGKARDPAAEARRGLVDDDDEDDDDEDEGVEDEDVLHSTIVKQAQRSFNSFDNRIDTRPSSRPLWDGIVRQRLSPFMSMEYQLLALIRNAGENGMTYGELSGALDHLTGKTVESIALRAEYFTACPSGLSDMYVKFVNESLGKERRLRIFSLHGWIERCRQIGLDDDSLAFELRLATASDWMQVGEHRKYTTAQHFQRHVSLFPIRAMTKDIALWRKGVAMAQRASAHPRTGILTLTSRNAQKADRPENAGPPADQIAQLDVASEAEGALGRPRKYIRVIGSDGELVKRTKRVVIPLHAELPSAYLYNKKTMVFFDVPGEYSGKGPVPLPPDWMTRTQPHTIVVPSTGKPPVTPPKTRKRKAGQGDDIEGVEVKAAPSAAEEKPAGVNRKSAGGSKKRKTEKDSGATDVQGATIVEDLQRGKQAPQAIISQSLPATAGAAGMDEGPSGRDEVPGDDQVSSVHLVAPFGSAAQQPAKSGALLDVESSVVRARNRSRSMEKGDCSASGEVAPAPLRMGEARDIASEQPSCCSQAFHSITAAGGDGALDRPGNPGQITKIPPDRSVDEDVMVVPDIPRPMRSRPADSRTNLTLHIKKVELLRCISDLGGIVEGGHALSRIHKGWFIMLQQRGEIQQSQQLFELDRKTTDKLTTAMLNEGSIRKLVVALQDGNEASRNVIVLSLTSVSTADVSAWIARHRSENAAVADASAPSGKDAAWSKRTARAQSSTQAKSTLDVTLRRLTTMNDDEVRQLFLQERVIAAQSYGYLMGKYRRAHTLLDILADLATPVHIGNGGTIERLVSKAALDTKTSAHQFCQVFPVTTASPVLARFLENPTNAGVPVSTAPLPIQQAIDARQYSTRLQIWKVLRVLTDLGLVEGRAYTHDMSSFLLPTVLKNATHFKLNDDAPLFNVGQADSMPECLGSLPLVTLTDRGDWWYALWNLAMTSGPPNAEVAEVIRSQTKVSQSSVDSRAYPSDIVRATKWQTGYQLTKSQKRYLSAWQTSGTREVLGLADRSAEELAYILAAPVEPVAAHLAYLRSHAAAGSGGAIDPTTGSLSPPLRGPDGEPVSKHDRDDRNHRQDHRQGDARLPGTGPPRKSTKRAKRTDTSAAEEAQQKQQAKVNVARKLQERARLVEAKWEALLSTALEECQATASMELNAYLTPIQKAYQRDPERFNPRLLRAGIKAFRNREFKPRKSCAQTIAPQVTLVRPEAAAGGEKSSRGASTSGPQRRGHRTTWTKEFEDLAVDAWVIVHTRCKASGLPWTLAGLYAALDNVIPGVDAGKMRKKVAQITRSSNAQQAYVDRLLDAWEGVYQRLRGTDALPDPNPESVTDFDLALYINVLRSNVRKGILSRLPPKAKEITTPDLLASAAEIEDLFAIGASQKHPKGIQLLWDVASDERKEAALLSETPIVPNAQRQRQLSKPLASPDRENQQISAVTKMVCSHPDSSFVSKTAHALLARIPEALLADVLKTLTRSEVIAENNPEDERILGRKFALTSRYLIAFEVPFSVGLVVDAQNVSEEISDQAFVDWPNDSTEGQYAGALSLNSHDMLSFEIDGTMSRCLRPGRRSYQTKLIDDFEIELSIGVQLNTGTEPEPLQIGGFEGEAPDRVAVDEAIGSRLLEMVKSAGPDGMPLDVLMDTCDMPLATFARYLHAMLGNSLHIVGYDQARVVDVDQFHSAWHVSCPAADMDDTTVLRRPRQWLDINGSLIKPAWVRCSTKVYSVIAQRPGISELHLRAMLAPLLDRLEVNDLLQELINDERVTRVYPSGAIAERALAWTVGLASPTEELLSSLFPRDGMW